MPFLDQSSQRLIWDAAEVRQTYLSLGNGRSQLPNLERREKSDKPYCEIKLHNVAQNQLQVSLHHSSVFGAN